jgi:hypothetical protein
MKGVRNGQNRCLPKREFYCNEVQNKPIPPNCNREKIKPKKYWICSMNLNNIII